MARKVDGVAARGGGPPGGEGAAPRAPTDATRRQRWLARLAFAAAFAAVVVVLLSGALRSVTALLVGIRGTGHRLRGGMVVPGSPRHRALARVRGPGRRAGGRDRGVRRCRAAVGDRAQRRARGSGRGRRARGTQQRPLAGETARRRGGAAAAAFRDHEPTVGRGEGREVRAQGQGHRARRRGGPARRSRNGRRGRAGAPGGRRRRRPARGGRRRRNPGSRRGHRRRAGRPDDGHLGGHPQPLRPRSRAGP